MPLADSTAHFKKYLIKERLFSEKRWQNLLAQKWDTIQNYGFAFGNIEQNQMPNEELFKKVIVKIEGYDYEKPGTWEDIEEKDSSGNPVMENGLPKKVKKQHPEPPWHLYRRTAFSCRLAAAGEMQRQWKSGSQKIRPLTDPERLERREEVKKKYPLTGILEGEKEPSEALEDLVHGWKEVDRITRPIDLSECTSLEQEMNLRRKKPAKKQRVAEVEESSNGFNVKLGDAKEEDATTDFNSVHKFEMAMTRFGVALELADLMDFTRFNVWLKRLLDSMNQDNLLYPRALTIQECADAHEKLFTIIEISTRKEGIREKLSSGERPLEKALTEAMDSLFIRNFLESRLLQPRPGGGKAPKDAQKETKGGEAAKKPAGKESKTAAKKRRTIEKATKDKQKEIDALKQELTGQGKEKLTRKQRKGDSKGEGKGKASGKGPALPKELRNGKNQATSGDNRKICFGYNTGRGCDKAEAGKECPNGWHICSAIGCKETHSAKGCPKAS